MSDDGPTDDDSTDGGPTDDDGDGREGASHPAVLIGVFALRSLSVLAILAALTLPVAVWERHWMAVGALAGTSTVTAALAWLVRNHQIPERPRVDLAGIAVAWMTISAAATPLTWVLAGTGNAGDLRDPASAWFETVSGVTTTGLTMVSDPAQISMTLQWWRSLLQWGGAAGVIIFALLVAEPSGDRDEMQNWSAQPGDGPRDAAVRILKLLAGLTALAVGGLWVTGDPLWRALNHALTASATGGFTITTQSAGDSSAWSQVVLAAIFTTSAVSFGTLWGAIARRGPAWHQRTQVRWAAALLVVGAGSSALVAAGRASPGGVLFNAASASATAGFTASDAQQTVPVVGAIAIISMFIGGAAGSTAGGVKTARVVWVAKAALRWLPQDERLDGKPYTWDGADVDADESLRRVVGAASLIALFLILVAVASIVLVALVDAPLQDAVYEVVSASSGVGLSSGITSAGLPPRFCSAWSCCSDGSSSPPSWPWPPWPGA